MYNLIDPHTKHNRPDDFQNLASEDLLSVNLELDELFFDLQNQVGYTINGIQPALTHGLNNGPLAVKNAITTYNNLVGSNGSSKASRIDEHTTFGTQEHWLEGNHQDSYMKKSHGVIDSSTWNTRATTKGKIPLCDSPSQTVPSCQLSPCGRDDCDSSAWQIPSVVKDEPFENRQTTRLEIPRQKPGRKSSGKYSGKNRKRGAEKGSLEYVEKRCRNNEAVRKSRDKAKRKQQETESRVGELTDENRGLQKRVELLMKELSVLRSLFVNVGASIPDRIKELLSE